MKILYYKRKDQYSFGGRMYPTGKSAVYVKILTGVETLTPRHADALKGLGHTLLEVSEPQR